MEFEYKINTVMPIKVIVDADSTSAMICWEYETVINRENKCNSCVIKGNTCETIPLTPNTECEPRKTSGGIIQWKGMVISYDLIQKAKTEGCNGCSAETKYEIIDSWLEKNTFTSCECGCGSLTFSSQTETSNLSVTTENETTLFFKANKTSKNEDCSITKEEILSSVTVGVKCSEDSEIKKVTSSYTISDGVEIPYTYYCDKCDECTPTNTKVYVESISYDKEYLLCSGGTYNYTIFYKVVDYDENCNKTVTNSIKKGTVEVPQCKSECGCGDITLGDVKCGCSDVDFQREMVFGSASIDVNENSTPCCEDHYVYTSGTIDYIGLVDGEFGKFSVNVELKMLVKADFDNTCNGNCNQTCPYEITYSTDIGGKRQKGKVLYPYTDEYGNPKWGEDKGPVPYQGGKVKVEFEYTEFTQYTDCTTATNQGKDSTIIDISSITCENVLAGELVNGNVPLTGEIVYKSNNNIIEYTVFQEPKNCEDNCNCEDIYI